MGMSYESNGTEKYSSVDVAVSFIEYSASKLFNEAIDVISIFRARTRT